MAGERDLQKLLSEMRPVQQPGEYVFCTISGNLPAGIDALCLFREREGWTLIVRRDEADWHGLAYEGSWAWIEITIHSSLEAVGFMAALARALADAGISCNAVSAYYHDHVFVQYSKAAQALAALMPSTSPQ
jgi:uncharacterized protein